MELREAVQSRRSIRCFLEDPVPERLINEIISEARWAQSWGNTQPWEVKVICGSPLDGVIRISCAIFILQICV